MRELERRVVLSVLDRKWREHLYEMDYLQEGIGLRAMAQRDPLVEYQREGFDLFAAMMDAIKEESVGYLFNLEVQVDDSAEGGATATTAACPARQWSRRASRPRASGPAAVHRADDRRRRRATPAQQATAAARPASDYGDVPRNAPCPCGSGKKYKRCHGDPRNAGPADPTPPQPSSSAVHCQRPSSPRAARRRRCAHAAAHQGRDLGHAVGRLADVHRADHGAGDGSARVPSPD